MFGIFGGLSKATALTGRPDSYAVMVQKKRSRSGTPRSKPPTLGIALGR
jgi:hypothetical protein